MCLCHAILTPKSATLFDHVMMINIKYILNKITQVKPRRRTHEAPPLAGHILSKKYLSDGKAVGVDTRSQTASYHKRVYVAAKQFVKLYMAGRHVASPYGLEIKMRRVFLMDPEVLRQHEAVQIELFNDFKRKEERNASALASLEAAEKFDRLVFEIEDRLALNTDQSPLERFRMAREQAEREMFPDRFEDPESEWAEFDCRRLLESLGQDLKTALTAKIEEAYLKNNSWAKAQYYLRPADKRLSAARFEIFQVLVETGLVDTWRKKIKMKGPKNELQAVPA